MRRKWGLALGVPVFVAAGLLLVGRSSNAADHLDAPGAEADPAADINDLFVFRSKDPAAGATKRTVFVMTVFPLADQQSRFSDKVDYEFRIEDAADATKKMNIKCTADTGTPQKVTGVKLKNVRSGAIADRATDGVFIAIGHQPSTELVAGKIKMKPNGYVWTAPDSTATSVPGLFAAGDVTDDVFRQAVTAAGMGCMAALEAERFLAAEGADRAAAE